MLQVLGRRFAVAPVPLTRAPVMILIHGLQMEKPLKALMQVQMEIIPFQLQKVLAADLLQFMLLKTPYLLSALPITRLFATAL